MWKKKRYDVTFRLEPRDIDDLLWMMVTLKRVVEAFDPGSPRLKRLDNWYWKIHNKCVEINRR